MVVVGLLLVGLVVLGQRLAGQQPVGLGGQLRSCRKHARRRKTDARGPGQERGGPAGGRRKMDHQRPARAGGLEEGQQRRYRRAAGQAGDSVRTNARIRGGAVQDGRPILSGVSGHAKRKSSQLVGEPSPGVGLSLFAVQAGPRIGPGGISGHGRQCDPCRPFAGWRPGVGGVVRHRRAGHHVQRGGPALALPRGRTRRDPRALHPGRRAESGADFVPFLPEAAGTRIEHAYQYTGPFWERHSYRAFPNW